MDDPENRFRQEIARKKVLPWIEVSQSARLNADVLGRTMPALEGSFLRPTADMPLQNMTWFCRGLLESAADHLVMWADYAAPLRFHPDAEIVHTLRPAFTLARATIESAAQAIWVLSPEELTQCVGRYFLLATWDLDEQVKAAESPESRIEVQKRRDEIFSALGLTRRTFRPPRYLNMIRDAADYLNLEDAVMRPDRVERVWRSAAAAAHGKQWPEFELRDRTDVGDGLFSSVPKLDAISEVLKVADQMLSAGVALFAIRVGREDELPTLWDEAAARLAAKMTTVDSEPIKPEDIPRFGS